MPRGAQNLRDLTLFGIRPPLKAADSIAAERAAAADKHICQRTAIDPFLRVSRKRDGAGPQLRRGPALPVSSRR